MKVNPDQITLNITFETKVSFVIEADFLILTLSIKSDFFDELPDRTFQSSHHMPLNRLSRDTVQTDLFKETVRREVRRLLPFHLAHEAGDLFEDIINVAAASCGLSLMKEHSMRTAGRTVSSEHATRTKRRLLELFGVKSHGRFRQWTKLKLIEAIESADFHLPEDEVRSYETIGSMLRMMPKYKNIAPKSSASLQKLVSTLEIDWNDLKRRLADSRPETKTEG